VIFSPSENSLFRFYYYYYYYYYRATLIASLSAAITNGRFARPREQSNAQIGHRRRRHHRRRRMTVSKEGLAEKVRAVIDSLKL